MQSLSVHAFRAGIDSLLGQIRDFSGDCEVLLLSPIELGDEVWREEFDPEFGKESVKVARALPSAYRKLSGKWDISYLAASDYAKPSSVEFCAGSARTADIVKYRRPVAQSFLHHLEPVS